MPACCHACVLLRHWLIVTAQNALVYRLLGRLDTGHEHTVQDAIRAYTKATHNHAIGHAIDFTIPPRVTR